MKTEVCISGDTVETGQEGFTRVREAWECDHWELISGDSASFCVLTSESGTGFILYGTLCASWTWVTIYFLMLGALLDSEYKKEGEIVPSWRSSESSLFQILLIESSRVKETEADSHQEKQKTQRANNSSF
ncbi:microsomal glutathione S-transferase 1 isoform X3 [Balaenoptera ricei]|uniref:microsomal glutathione S-transferase 1 isoform X3 n=1 Tax=Balaenoptera ricei TaxID=2746895 RepID=UPI0028BE2806|nr:microsomal glutathione S-transferase 1 isoform X3 [Balaenoptera ricei]XP_059791371.1 microsomal glutathione S-transferase 1 isoform X3 [Balaenoptera ricei]